MSSTNRLFRSPLVHVALAAAFVAGCSFPTSEFNAGGDAASADIPDIQVPDVPSPTDIPGIDAPDVQAPDVQAPDVPVGEVGTDAPDVVAVDADDAGGAPDAQDAGADAGDAGGAPDVPGDVPLCPTGQAFCVDGCVDTETSATHCGRCGNTCSAANATSVCAASACAFACNPGFADCNGLASDGCEANLTTAATCGACMNRCDATNGTPTCAAGTCAITCNTGFANCDGSAVNGCETNLQTDPAHCGSCPTACANTNGVPSCTAGACGITCNAGFGNCDGNTANGCEVTTSTDVANCRTCGTRCGAGQSCVNSNCTTVCPAATCSGVCVDLSSSVTNCGACGRTCTAPNGTPRCAASACGIASCNSGFADCDTTSPGCETGTQTNPASCGRCNNRCAFPNASAVCVGGACAIGACEPGFGNCDGVATNGCETDLRSDVSNCGTCSNRCTPPNAVPSCSGSTCGIIRCNPGYANCDGNIANGCEVNTTIDAANCGTCGNFCRSSYAGGSNACAASVCTPTCNAGYGNCDGNVSNGCEASINTNLNCGSCGRICNGGCGATGGTCGLGPGSPYIQTPYRLPLPTLIDACALPGRVVYLPNVDDSNVLVPIPFATRFWNAPVAAGAMVNISTNGWLSPNGVGTNALYGVLPDPASPNSVIAPYFTDLVTGPQGICVGVTGVAPGRRWVVEWADAVLFADRSRHVTFEVLISESGAVEMYYGAMATNTTTINVAIGIENQVGNNSMLICNPANVCTVASNNVIGWSHQ